MSFTLTGTLKDFGSGIPAGVEGYVQAKGHGLVRVDSMRSALVASQALTVNGNYLDAACTTPRQPSGLAGLVTFWGARC